VAPLFAELTRAHLVTESVPGRYTFHDLLRAYATEQAHAHDSAETRHAALHRLLDHYLYTAHTAVRLLSPQTDPLPLQALQHGTTPENLADRAQAAAWFGTEQQVLLAASRQAAASGFDGHTWQLAWHLLNLVHQPGQGPDWAAARTAALDATHRLATRTDPTVAHRYLSHTPGGPDAEAAPRDTLDRLGGRGDDAGQAATHMHIACALERQGRYRDALDQARQAVERYRAADRPDGQARALNAVGWYHMLLGDYREAFAHCQQALTVHQVTPGSLSR
jgi:tetratricopeptide (TPR) repeat protein